MTFSYVLHVFGAGSRTAIANAPRSGIVRRSRRRSGSRDARVGLLPIAGDPTPGQAYFTPAACSMLPCRSTPAPGTDGRDT